MVTLSSRQNCIRHPLLSSMVPVQQREPDHHRPKNPKKNRHYRRRPYLIHVAFTHSRSCDDTVKAAPQFLLWFDAVPFCLVPPCGLDPHLRPCPLKSGKPTEQTIGEDG